MVSFEDLIKDINEKVIPSLGHFPSRAEIRKIRFNLGYSLERAINKFGMNSVILATGNQPRMRSRGYWKNWENVKDEITKNFSEMLSHGIFPSYQQLEAARITVVSISKEFGGMAELADKFGCRLASVYKCRDGDFAQSIYECILDEYLFSREINHIIHPSIDGRFYADFYVCGKFVEIWGYRKKDSKSKIGKHYNCKRKLKEKVYSKLALTPIIFEGDFFEKTFFDLKTVENELDKIFSSAGACIEKKHPFDMDIIASCGDIWCEKTVIEAINRVIAKIGKFPSLKELETNGIRSAVSRFGGITYFRKKMGHIDVKDHRSLHIKWNDQIIIEKLKNE